MKHKWTLVAWLLVALFCVSVKSAKRKQPDVNRENGIIDIDDDTHESFLDLVEISSEPDGHNTGRSRRSPAGQYRRKPATVQRGHPLKTLQNEELLTGSGDGSNDGDELDIDASGEDPSGVEPELTTSTPIVCRNTTLPGQKNGGFRPRCTADGKFERMQCDNSGRQCWCVDPSDGRELAGTRRTSPTKPACLTLGVSTTTTTTTTTLPPTPSTTRASSTKQPTTKLSSSYIASSSTMRSSAPGRQSFTPKQTTVARQPTTSVRPTFTTTTTATPTSKSTSTWTPGKKISQIPNGSDGDDDEILLEATKNPFDNTFSGPKSHKINLRSTIIGQPGILAGIIGAAVVILLCLVLLIMFVIYRMHRKSQDPAIYFVDTKKSNKKAGYMKALDHDVYT